MIKGSVSHVSVSQVSKAAVNSCLNCDSGSTSLALIFFDQLGSYLSWVETQNINLIAHLHIHALSKESYESFLGAVWNTGWER